MACLPRATRSAPWLRFEDDTWTLADVVAEVDRFAVGLAERGVVQGDCVAILLGNRPETLFTWFAANRLGAIAMPLNPAYKVPELGAILRLASPRLFVVGDDLRGVFTEDATRESPTTNVVSPADLARAGSHAPRAPVAPDDVAVLLATSGTTGAPKAVMQTHRTYMLTAEAFPWWLGLTADDRLLCTLPLFHINAQAYSTLGALACGADLALVPRFSASRFWDDVRRHGATEVNAVGAMVHILSSAEPRTSDREHALRLVLLRARPSRGEAPRVRGALRPSDDRRLWPLRDDVRHRVAARSGSRRHTRRWAISDSIHGSARSTAAASCATTATRPPRARPASSGSRTRR